MRRMTNTWAAELLRVSPVVARECAVTPAARQRNRIRVAMARHTLRLVAELTCEPPLVLKGEPLALDFFGSAERRSTHDVDILVRRGEVAPLVNRLLGEGLTLSSPPRPSAYNQVMLERHDLAPVEIHWRVALPSLPASGTEALLRRSEEFEFDNIRVGVLDPESLLHLCYHFEQHTGFAKGLLDIAAWLDRYEEGFDWDRFFDRAAQIGVSPLVRWPLKVLNRVTGRSLARSVGSRLETPGTEDPLVEMTAEMLSDPLGSSVFGLSKIGYFSLQTLCGFAGVEGVRNRTRALLRPLLLGPHRLGRLISHRADSTSEMNRLTI